MKLRADLAALLPRMNNQQLYKFCGFYEKYAPHLAEIATGVYDRLPPEDQSRFVVWFLKRWGKIDLVNPVEKSLYDSTIERLRTEPRPVEELDGRPYRLRDMASQGYDFKMLGYDWWLGAHDIRYDQYQHGDVQLSPDDVIIDAGAFIGDTAVFFHHRLAGRCRIHSFELLDENLALLQHNLARNGVRDDQVVLNRLALADTTGSEIVIADGATQGSTSIFGKKAGGVKVQTITLDDYVTSLKLDRVDFIKMDIEGAEVQALAGARHTIAHFRPKLAICLYHQWDDLFRVPRAIHATGVDYQFRFKWVQLKDGWEAILHAIPTERASHIVRPPATADAGPDPWAAALDVLTRAYARKFDQTEALRREAQLGASPPTSIAEHRDEPAHA